MKKYFTIIIICLMATDVFCQLEWVSFNSGNYCNQMLRTTSGSYVLLNDHTVFIAVDTTGKTLFNNFGVLLPGNPYYENTVNIFEMADQTFGIMANVYDFEPATGQADFYSDVVLFDQEGSYTGYIETRTQYNSQGVGLSGGDILVYLENQDITRFNADGIWVWSQYPPGSLMEMALKPLDTLLLLTSMGLVVMDEHGEVAAQYPDIKHERIKTGTLGSFACIQGDTLLSYTSSYSLLAQVSFSGDEIKDFDVANGKIAVLTESDSVHVFDADLIPVGSFQLVEDAAVFTFISVGDQTVTLAGTEHYGSIAPNVGTYAVFLKEYGFDGNDFGTSHDIGVVGVNPVQEVEVQPNGQGSYWLILHDVEVKVKNFGANAVSSLSLWADNNIASFDSLNLLPGTEQTLIMPQIKKIYFGDNPSGQVIDYCVYTSHPDFRLDADASNDSYCTDFLVNGKETIEPQNAIYIYPNPTSDYLNFQLRTARPVQEATFRIMDAQGRVLREFKSSHLQDTFIVPLDGWAAGVYFLEASENGVVLGVERFVVKK